MLLIRQRANEMVQQAEERSRELKRSANSYCEDALRRTEEAVAEAYDEIKKSRAHQSPYSPILSFQFSHPPLHVGDDLPGDKLPQAGAVPGHQLTVCRRAGSV